MIRTIVAFVACLALSGNALSKGNRDAKATGDALSGNSKQSAAKNPQCRLFTVTELEKYAGKPLALGRNAAAGSELPAVFRLPRVDG